ncbi:ParB/RepB/Spo0J family partition protein [Citricoccus sp. I39-566]|uniref:ParB/RepB/Spo0J family partition protein n=1 Tax=Citricoccus sp. I39-566 TaxID=3073268 RepID=UPI00286A7B27|nr:ParB/RepB/Spo0J family partition protein [Citricoccus sp. I39-566]WMY80057.1 ParB/RepB/Spo0J family partition protein [Citricoccus sp. I39-566]
MTTQTLKMIPPTTLTVDTNVRTRAQLGADFIASIREHGVLQPVTACDKGGALHVLMGQRRTLAAVEAEVAEIPVYIVENPDEADRLAKQMVENDHRAALGARDRAEAFHQLSLLGISPEQIAKRTATPKATVRAGLTALASAQGTSALDQGLTLLQAATLSEYEDDAEATADLLDAAARGEGHFEHAERRHAKRRAEQKLLAVRKAALEAAGQTVVTDHDDWVPLHRLITAAGERLSAEQANAVRLSIRHSWNDDAADEVIEAPVVIGWQEAGYREAPGYGSTVRSGPMTDEEKAERQQLIERNKAMVAASEVRRAFLIKMLAATKLPADASQFVARAITAWAYDLYRAPQPLAAELLGMPVAATAYAPLSDHTRKTNRKPDHTVLAMCLAGIEHTMAKDCWRNPTSAHTEYLETLVTWGYTLSDVEALLVSPAE